MSVRFWGVRGTIATPGPDTVRYGGNTTCIEVRCGPHLLIFDAGTGIRLLGDALVADGPVDADLFFTHTHLDHVVGLPFFAPLHRKDTTLNLWEGHLGAEADLQSVLHRLIDAPLHPVPLDQVKLCFAQRKFQAGDTLRPRPGVTIRTAPLNHPNGATGYRVEWQGRSVCIITDTEHPPVGHDPHVLDLVRGADVMIYDSTFEDGDYPRHVGWGHSTWQEAVRIAAAVGVARPIAFHHAPDRTDAWLDGLAARLAACHPGAIVAVEGMRITV
jgi:phosphoribosyl 1,2-cyclic phosphodiesterase